MAEIMSTLELLQPVEKINFKRLFFLSEERQGGEVIKVRKWALAKTDLCLNPSSTLESV